MASFSRIGRAVERVILFLALVFASTEYWKDQRVVPAVPPPNATVRRISEWQDLATQGIRVGPARAPVTIVAFMDYQCPFCQQAEEALATLQQRYGSKIAIVYRQFPLHEHARSAGIAAYCAAQVGQFEPFHRMLFSSQSSMGVGSWGRLAAAAGIHDTATFNRCLHDPGMAERVSRDSLAAVTLRAIGTPTIVLNDVFFPGYPGTEALDQHVQTVLDSIGYP